MTIHVPAALAKATQVPDVLAKATSFFSGDKINPLPLELSKIDRVPAVLAKTTFFSGDKINPLPLDAYGATGNGIYNKIAEFVSGLGIDPNGLTRGSEFLKKNLPDIKSLYKAGKTLANGGSLASRVDAANTLFKSGAPLLASVLPTNLANSITEGMKNNADTLAKLGDVVKKVEGVNLSDMAQVGNLLSDMTGANGPFDVIDNQSAVGVMTGIAINACKNGIPSAINTVLNSSENRAVLQETMKKIMPEVVKLGDVDYLKEVADFGKAHGIDLGKVTQFDKFIETFRKGTSQDTVGTFAKYLEAGQALDPGFATMDLNGTQVTNTWPASAMSADAYQCLKTDVVKEQISGAHVAAVTNKTVQHMPAGSFLGSIANIAKKQAFTMETPSGQTGQMKVTR